MKKILENQTLRKFLRNKKAVFGVIVVALLVLAVLLIPLFMDLDPYTTDRTAGFNASPAATSWGRMTWDEICSPDFFTAGGFPSLWESPPPSSPF